MIKRTPAAGERYEVKKMNTKTLMEALKNINLDNKTVKLVLPDGEIGNIECLGCEDEKYLLFYKPEAPEFMADQLLFHMDGEADDKCWGDSPYFEGNNSDNASKFADCEVKICVRNGSDDEDFISFNVSSIVKKDNTLLIGSSTTDRITVIRGLNEDTPVSIWNDKLRVDWVNLREGISGDYNSEDPEDINLLRFDVYAKRDDSDWEEVDDASYCTNVPADTDPDELERLLRVIFDRYSDVIDDYIENGTSVKKLGEELSWIAPNENK